MLIVDWTNVRNREGDRKARRKVISIEYETVQS
jgi:hypothetical protein